MIKKMLLIGLLLSISFSIVAEDQPLDMKQLASNYFEAMVATQAPNATSKELEAYLALLVDDVGHSHLPWDSDDSRTPEGKNKMREGMTFYLGTHTEYKAELLNVFTFNDSAIAIRYKHHAKGIHPQSQQAIEYTRVMMEVLELEGDKVAVIRKHHE